MATSENRPAQFRPWRISGSLCKNSTLCHSQDPDSMIVRFSFHVAKSARTKYEFIDTNGSPGVALKERG